MLERLSKLLDRLSEFLADRKGLVPIIGIGLVVINLIFKIVSGFDTLADLDLFLHVGIITGLFGLLLARAL